MKGRKSTPVYPYLIFTALIVIVYTAVLFQYMSSRNAALEKLNSSTEYNSIVLANDLSKVLEKSEMILDILELELESSPGAPDVSKIISDFRLKYFDLTDLYIFSAEGINYNPRPEQPLLEKELNTLFNYHKNMRIRSNFIFDENNTSSFWISRAAFDSSGKVRNVFICTVGINSILSFDEIKAMYNISEIFVLDSSYKVLYSGKDRQNHPENTKLIYLDDKMSEKSVSGIFQFSEDNLCFSVSKIIGYPFFIALEAEYGSVLKPLNFQFLLYFLVVSFLFLLSLFLIRSIVSQKRKQTLLEEKLMQQSRLEALGRITGGVAHEFNNINLAIMSASELLKESGSPEEENSYMDIIITSIKKASSIIQDLLSYSRNNFMVLKNIVSIPDTLTDSVARAVEACGKDVNIQVFSHRQVQLKADQKLLTDAFFNIIENAIHSVGPDGTVVIDYKVLPLEEIHYADDLSEERTDRKRKYVEITVEDNGAGISADNIEKIFDPFFSTKDPGKGVGLGLSSVYGIIKEHAGFIGVESILKQGTTFRIALPLEE